MAIVAFLVIPSQGSGPPSVTPPVPETASTIPYFTATFPGQAVIEINDFEFGVDSPVNVGAPTSGTGAGKAKLAPLVIHKLVDQASPALFSVSTLGEHFTDIHLVFLEQTPTESQQTAFLVYEFQTVFVTDITWSPGDDPTPHEAVTFAYGGLKLVYKRVNSDGTVASANASWDQIHGTPQLQAPSPPAVAPS